MEAEDQIHRFTRQGTPVALPASRIGRRSWNSARAGKILRRLPAPPSAQSPSILGKAGDTSLPGPHWLRQSQNKTRFEIGNFPLANRTVAILSG